MKNCEICRKKFSFGKIFKSFLIGYRNIECPNCHTRYEHAFKNRILGAISVAIGVIAGQIIMNSSELSVALKITMYIAIALPVTLISSFFLFLFFTFEKNDNKERNTY
jgi:CXXC-20-CXXC protein